MRTNEELREAHDFLQAVLEHNDTIPKGEGLPEQEAMAMHAAHDAIGWALGCPGCTEAFGNNYETLRKKLYAAGFRLQKYTSHAE